MKRITVLLILLFLPCGVLHAQDEKMIKEFRHALMPLPSGVHPKGPAGVMDKPALVLNLRFELNSYALTPEAVRYLDALGKAIVGDSELHRYIYRIEGHTCSLGSAEYNRQLSLKRAEAVVRYLVEHFSLKREQFEVVGYGEDRPITPNDTEEGMRKNRRVVVVNTLRKFEPSEESPSTMLYVSVKYAKGNTISELKPEGILTRKDGYAVEFIPRERCYVYVYQVSQRIDTLFPNEKYSKGTNPVEPGRLYRVPLLGRWLYLDENRGREEFIVIAYREALRDPLEICRRLLSKKVCSKGIGKTEEIPPEQLKQGGPVEEGNIPQDLFVWRRSFIHD